MRTTEHDQHILEGRVVDGQHQPADPAPAGTGHGSHGWMMIACCIPMLVIAVILVATGVASTGFLFAAVGGQLTSPPGSFRRGLPWPAMALGARVR